MDPRRRVKRPAAGFTLAELVVASALISIAMGGVYWLFNSTVRTWSIAERGEDPYLNARLAVATMGRELDNILYPTSTLFQGSDSEFEMIIIAETMDIEEDEDESGRRVLWVRYRYNAAGNTLERQERQVRKLAFGAGTPEGESDEELGAIEGRLDLGRRIRTDIAQNVRDFEVYYYWVPAQEDKSSGAPPPWRPLCDDKGSEGCIYAVQTHEEGWGLPNGIGFKMEVENPENTEAPITIEYRQAFRGPVPYRDQATLDSFLGDKL